MQRPQDALSYSPAHRISKQFTMMKLEEKRKKGGWEKMRVRFLPNTTNTLEKVLLMKRKEIVIEEAKRLENGSTDNIRTQ